jgi:hypothetical protein
MATTRSITPGTSAQQERTLGLVTSESWDLPTPVEYGRTVTEAPATQGGADAVDTVKSRK